MNKFAIKKKISHNNNTTTTNETATVRNLKENVTYTKEQNQLYNHIYSIVANSGSIVVGKVEQLLYLLYNLEGEDNLLVFIFHDPTQTYLNRVRSLLHPMDNETRELVRKNLHNYVYDHLLTYDYKTLESLKSIH